jgi:transcriptional regulator with XRE-family HTH domain
MTSTLLRATLELLEQTNAQDWQDLSEKTGLKVPWIRQLALGNIDEPGVNKIEKLYKALTDKKLDISK